MTMFSLITSIDRVHIKAVNMCAGRVDLCMSYKLSMKCIRKSNNGHTFTWMHATVKQDGLAKYGNLSKYAGALVFQKYAKT